MLLVLRNGLQNGSRTAWFTGLGCCAGIATHATAAVLGLSALLAASAAAYSVVKLAGAAYLAYLGIRMLISAVRPGSPAEKLAAPPRAVLHPKAAFRQGLFTNLLNPKIALLFLTLLPQFVGAGEPRLRTTAVLAAVFLGLAVLWWRLFTLALTPVSRFLSTPKVRRGLDGIAGSVMIGIGLKVAFEHR